MATDKEQELKHLASSVKDAYPDFVTGVVAFARMDDVIDETISFIRENPNASTGAILEYMDTITPQQEIIITD